MAKEYTPASRNREAFAAMTDTPGNVPPQAVELEEAVLGALMLEKDSIITVQEFITPEAFYTEEHRTIYRAIEELSTELKPIDLYTVTERLKVRKELQKVGGASYLAQLTQKVGSAANVEFHAKIIAQKYVQRELIRSATEIQRRSYDESTDVTELIGYAESEIFKVAEGHVKRSVQSSKDLLAKALMQIEEASKNTSAFNGVPSGFMAIDRVTLGWQLSDLIIVAARPSMGKTAFVLSMARNMAVDHERPVAFFSLEMSSVQLMMRLIIAETGIPGNDIKSGRLTPEQWRHLESATKPLGGGSPFTSTIRRRVGLRIPLESPASEDTQRHPDHHHRLFAVDDRRNAGFEGQPRTGGGFHLPHVEGHRQGVERADHRPLAVEPCYGAARRFETPPAFGPARIGGHRAGRRHRGFHPSSRILRYQSGRERYADGGYGRDHHRQAP